MKKYNKTKTIIAVSNKPAILVYVVTAQKDYAELFYAIALADTLLCEHELFIQAAYTP